MDCIHKRFKPGEVLCAEPDVIRSNDDRPKIVRCETHCHPALCCDYTAPPYPPYRGNNENETV